MEQDKKEICLIKVVFLADNDEHAIKIKQRIKEALSDTTDVQIDFRLMPSRPPASGT